MAQRVSTAPMIADRVTAGNRGDCACVISRHEHVESSLHVVLRGSVKHEVLTRGKTLQFGANPGTIFILPRGTIDELRWAGPTHRIAVAVHLSLLVNAMDETAHESDVELTEIGI